MLYVQFSTFTVIMLKDIVKAYMKAIKHFTFSLL